MGRSRQLRGGGIHQIHLIYAIIRKKRGPFDLSDSCLLSQNQSLSAILTERHDSSHRVILLLDYFETLRFWN
jgi:hypothetical protein